jgi:hypothetical protein
MYKMFHLKPGRLNDEIKKASRLVLSGTLCINTCCALGYNSLFCFSFLSYYFLSFYNDFFFPPFVEGIELIQPREVGPTDRLWTEPLFPTKH